ncbi:D-glycero-D-manno-heptose 7-phosphate kinase [Candidatus Nitrosopumilus koreensis AR1]|uniref:D-glycero-D-manno-heptose 7-phosphate kinase n=1 Tax=Candidatus Nitrosopumilus koreensis AR1 TaxID=1229908 RepID=K0B3H1_9ARCH|nr:MULTISPECIES: D-glycero-D-manno-heptose 7-phosphate kinase [Nitrosopumilus]AFS80009.1 D-glycero-D-manno-heptose 7-phosphate kinase [Candidatus Nitrosopumilus koreensis AR1]
MIVGITPVRISFAGGGTDLPEFYNDFEGNVLTTTIDQFTYVIFQHRNDTSFQSFSPDFQKHYKATELKQIEIEDGTEIASSIIKFLDYNYGSNITVCSDAPPGSGLGSSSSLAVNLVNVITKLQKKNWQSSEIAETAFKIEREILHWPMGKQDEYATAFGGFNFIKFTSEKTTVSPISLSNSLKTELQKNLVLFFVGKTRESSPILSNQIERIKQKNQNILKSLQYVKDLSLEMCDSIKKSDITKFGELLHKGWEAKKQFSDGVSNQKIDDIYNSALKSGALGGKLTGAGGGGHMLLYCESSKQPSLIKKMNSLGLQKVNSTFYDDGPKILNLYDFATSDKT